MTTRKDLRVALVGCGRISASHFEAIPKVEGLALSAAGDGVAARAKAAGDRLGVPWFTSYEKMLEKAPCEIVTIATPSGLHPSQGILAAKAGKHVVCEKPMAITLDSADDLVHACDAAKVHLFVV